MSPHEPGSRNGHASHGHGPAGTGAASGHPPVEDLKSRDSADDFDDDDFDEQVDETLDLWEYFGWLDLLPAGAAALTSLLEDGMIAKVDFDAVIAEAAQAGEFDFLEGDRVWPVIAERLADDAGITEDMTYAEYLENMTEDRQRWLSLVERDPTLAVTGLNELVSLMVRLGLFIDTGREFEIAEETPDPIDLLPLTEDEIDELVGNRMLEDAAILVDSLHDFLFHSTADRMQTTLEKLSDRSGLPADTTRVALAALVADPDSGLTADRFGPLTTEGITKLTDHQKFTLVVDRTAAAFAEHAH